MPDTRANILIKNTFWVYFSKLFSQLIGVVALVLVIKKLPVELYGTFTFLVSGIIVFNIVAVSPVISIFNRYIPELYQNREYKKMGRLINYGTLLSGITIGVMMYVVYLLRENASQFFNIKDLEQYLLAFGLFIVARYLQIIFNSIITSLLLQKQASIIKLVNSLLRSALYIGFLPIMSVNILLYVEMITSVVFFAMGFFIYWKFYAKLNLKSSPVEGYQSVTKKRIIKFGLFSSFNELGAGVISRSSDFYIISAMSNPFILGLYAFASRIYEILLRFIPIEDLITVLRPLFIQKFIEKHEQAEFNQAYNFIVKVMVIIFLLPTLYFINFGQPIINLVFDPKYISAYAVTCITLTSSVVMAFFFPLGIVTQLKEKVDIAFYSKIIVVFSIIGGIYAMKYFGIEGVAVVTLMGEILKNLFVYIILHRKIQLNYCWREYRRFILLILLMLLPMWFANSVSSIFQLGVATALFFAYAVAVTVLFHPFNRVGVAQLNKLWKMSKGVLQVHRIKSIVTGFRA